jgi:septin 2
LRLTVVDTPGFGDAIDNTDWWVKLFASGSETTFQLTFQLLFSFKSIIQYIDDQFERYLRDESGLNRRNIVDNRVHCCFYFISPYGHG